MAQPGELVAGLRRAGMDLLARREHARGELKSKLQRRFGECEEIETVLQQLADEGLQDDWRFAEGFVRFRSLRGQGPLRIARDLARHGVAEEIRSTVLEFDHESWYQSACTAREKRFGHDHPEDVRERAKQTRFLEQRGFSADQVRKALTA